MGRSQRSSVVYADTLAKTRHTLLDMSENLDFIEVFRWFS